MGANWRDRVTRTAKGTGGQCAAAAFHRTPAIQCVAAEMRKARSTVLPMLLDQVPHEPDSIFIGGDVRFRPAASGCAR